MARVLLENLAKIYPGDRGREVVAVDDANLEIRDREFMVLVGPSGCGKSTTLRMIAGLEEISRGAIYIDGRRVNDVPPKDRDIAMVFQNYALYPHMTVYKNMAFGLALRRHPRAEIDRRVREAAQILGLTDDMLQRRPGALSGGQSQRVALGRAIVRNPKVFLFDEPLSNLDAKMRVQMRAEITRLHRRLASTMIYVTHDQVEAMTMGDRICLMKDGRIQQVAPPLEIYHNPANMFVASFIGSPPMNFVAGTIRQEGGALCFVEEPGPANEPGLHLRVDKAHTAALGAWIDRPLFFGLRPENFSLETGGTGPHHTISATIENLERMGAETYLYLQTPRHPFIARTSAPVPARPGARLELSANMEKAQYFAAADRAPFLKPGGDLDLEKYHAACARIV
jgi:multiple sugar transport system ATP-binding protein